MLTSCSILGFKSVYAEYPSPDERHSILVQQGVPATLMSEWFEETYSISTPEPFRQTQEFYSRSTYEGENSLDNELDDVRWIDIEHIAYGHGDKTRFCNIYQLNSLSDCSNTPPKQLKNPSIQTREDRLIVYSQQGKTQGVQAALREGVDVNYRTPYKSTALMKASESGHLPILRLLIKAGVDVNAENSLARTALYNAIENNHTEAVKLLLDAKAKIRDADFILAVGKGQTKIVSYLLAAGANPNTVQDSSPIIVDAIIRNNTDIVRLLLDNGAAVDGQSSIAGETPLMYATLWGREDMVRLLLEYGADANAQDKTGRTPLSNAVDGVGRTIKEPNQDIIALLLQWKANINANGRAESIMVKAAEKGDLRLIQTLLQQGAKVDDTDENGDTALIATVSSEQTDVVKFLINKGANVNALSRSNETPLSIAARERALEICKLLLQAGAEVNANPHTEKNAIGRTALDQVTNERVVDDSVARQDIYDLLRKYGGKTAQELKTRAH